jgi:ribosomal protein S18 acetylase RimI-like enzyme
MTITYRDAVAGDAAAIDGIFDASFCDTFGHMYRPEDLAAFLSSFSIADWETELRDPAYAFRIAEVDGAPVGYVKLGPVKFAVDTDRPALLLDQIYLLKAHQGVGIARGLMDWSIDEARRRGADELYLTVFIDNGRAKSLYERYDFEAVGRYDFMVGSHADEDIIMRKML